jgi:hypothetical protein
MSAERREQAADAFWRDEHAVNEHAEALATIAQRIKFRVKSVIGLPIARKTKYFVGLSAVSELVAARLLVSYHIAHQRPMMGAFLDALGIAHEDGLIAEEEVKAPAPETLKKAVAALMATFPPEDVSLYLATLTWQDADAWSGLADLPETTLAGKA